MMRRTLLVLPTTLGLLLSALPAQAQSCEPERGWRWDRLRDRWVKSEVSERTPRTAVVTVGGVRFEEGPYVNPRAPRAWQPSPTTTTTTTCAPAPTCEPDRRVTVVVGRVTDESCAPRVFDRPARHVESLPVAERVDMTCAPQVTTRRAPPATEACEPRWQPTQPATPQPARYIPREWRSALSAEALLDAHRRIVDAVDRAARRAVIAEVSRQSTLTVDQVITLAGALPTSAERLEALTALHPATTDQAGYGRTYRLLSHDDQCTLHVRITRTFDAATAAQNDRLQRLRHEERELQRVMGDDE